MSEIPRKVTKRQKAPFFALLEILCTTRQHDHMKRKKEIFSRCHLVYKSPKRKRSNTKKALDTKTNLHTYVVTQKLVRINEGFDRENGKRSHVAVRQCKEKVTQRL